MEELESIYIDNIKIIKRICDKQFYTYKNCFTSFGYQKEDLFQEVSMRFLKINKKYIEKLKEQKYLTTVIFKVIRHLICEKYNQDYKQILYDDEIFKCIPAHQSILDIIECSNILHKINSNELLLYIEGYSIREISKIENISEGGIKNRLKNAINNLANNLGVEFCGFKNIHEQKRQQAIEMYKKGISRKKIREELGYSTGALGTILAKEIASGNIKKSGEEKRKFIFKELQKNENKNLPVYQLCQKFGISRETLRRYRMEINNKGVI